MSLIRMLFWLAIIVLLLPTDNAQQAQITGAATAAFERAVTFCDRNPSTCAEASQLWATFVRKAEFGIELASRMVRERMANGQQQHPAPSQVGFEPGPERGTLSNSDMAPQWRGPGARATY
jgi:hypothetical protein